MELPLPEGGACLLGSLNLGAYVEDGVFDFTKLGTDVADCVDYLNEVLELGIDKHPLEIQVSSAKRWRAIGLGFMGLHDAMLSLGITYGDENSITFTERVTATMLYHALVASSALASELGSFDNCCNQGVVDSDIFQNLVEFMSNESESMKGRVLALREYIMKYGIRNAQLLTVAPTGSIGTMLNISTGIEPHFALEYTRKVESFGDKDIYFDIKVDSADAYMKKHNLKTIKELPEWFITSADINPVDRMAVQGAAQKFIDNSISSTINLPEETSVEQVREIYWKAHELGLKGVTVFRSNSMRSAILTNKKEDEEVDESKEVGGIDDLGRGELRQIDKEDLVYKAKVMVNGCGKLNLHMGFDEDGKLYDVYAIRSGSGGCSSNIQALVIALSHIIRLGGNIEEFGKSIAGTQACASYAVARSKGVEVSPGHSCGSGIAKLVISTIKEMEKTMIGKKVVNKVEHKAEQLSEVDFGIKKKAKLEKWECPSCHATLVKQGGCVTCTECGFSKCD